MIRAQHTAQPDKAKKLRDDLAAAEAEVQRYVAAIGSSGTRIESLVAALRSAEQRRGALRNELAATENHPALEALCSQKLEARLVARAKEWRSVLAQDVPLARQALKALLAGPISLQREGGGYNSAKHIRTRLPGSGSAQIVPPCASTIERQIDSPSATFEGPGPVACPEAHPA